MFTFSPDLIFTQPTVQKFWVETAYWRSHLWYQLSASKGCFKPKAKVFSVWLLQLGTAASLPKEITWVSALCLLLLLTCISEVAILALFIYCLCTWRCGCWCSFFCWRPVLCLLAANFHCCHLCVVCVMALFCCLFTFFFFFLGGCFDLHSDAFMLLIYVMVKNMPISVMVVFFCRWRWWILLVSLRVSYWSLVECNGICWLYRCRHDCGLACNPITLLSLCTIYFMRKSLCFVRRQLALLFFIVSLKLMSM